jgi:filamentous hemagglutinin
MGRAPLGPDGFPINLHHMLQTNTSPLAEVTQTFHQQYSNILHINPSTMPSGIDRGAFDRYRASYWRARANDFEGK